MRLMRSRPRGVVTPLSRHDDTIEIPDKLYLRIGEVAELTGIQPYILRYWESEFGTLRPAKSRSGQRMYKRKDILADRKSTRLNSSHIQKSRMPSSA